MHAAPASHAPASPISARRPFPRPARSPRPLPEPLESRTLFTTQSVPVPAPLDATASMGEVVDFPDGFGPNWFLDTGSPVLRAASLEGSFQNDSRAVMEFPLASIPAGSRIDSVRLRYHLLGATGPIEGGSPSLRFQLTPGDGRITVEEFSDASAFPTSAPTPEFEGPTDPGDRTLTVSPDLLQPLVGRASHARFVGTGSQSVDLSPARVATGIVFGITGDDDVPPPPPPPPPPPQSGQITGVCFDGRDGDGDKDPNEPGLKDWLVYLDADKDGAWDESEPSTWTTAAGTFTFAAIAPGTYTVREVQQPGWQQTVASSAGVTVTLRAGCSVSNVRLGNSQDASISGTVFNDANGSGGLSAGEKGLSGLRIWLDADNDGKRDASERSVLTDATGNYRFADLPAGVHRVRVAAPTGWRHTAPSSDTHKVKLTGGSTVTGKSFGFTRLALLSGTVFHDRDADKTRDAGDSGLANWRVFIDKDNDGQFVKGERSVLIDASGNFKFRDLPPGTHRVGVVQPSGWRSTTPAGGAHSVTLSPGATVTHKLFGHRRIG